VQEALLAAKRRAAREAQDVHAYFSLLTLDTMAEDVGIVASLAFGLLFRSPSRAGGAPAVVGDVLVRIQAAVFRAMLRAQLPQNADGVGTAVMTASGDMEWVQDVSLSAQDMANAEVAGELRGGGVLDDTVASTWYDDVTVVDDATVDASAAAPQSNKPVNLGSHSDIVTAHALQQRLWGGMPPPVLPEPPSSEAAGHQCAPAAACVLHSSDAEVAQQQGKLLQ